jgi:hypothetical protein
MEQALFFLYILGGVYAGALYLNEETEEDGLLFNFFFVFFSWVSVLAFYFNRNNK